jgi:alpha-L-rhamnosidase
LLLSTEYPSWGFEVMNGANTIWERWNSYIKGKGFENNAGMNSFNHYAFGSVNEWLFGNAAGIKVNEAGYKTFIIKPEIAKQGINYVKATYQSINGTIKSAWKKENNQLVLEIIIPVNTRADVFIPCKNKDGVKENNQLLSANKDLIIKELKDGYLQISAGSGTYRFTSLL